MPGIWILWSKQKNFVITFQKENGNTFTLLIIFVVKSSQKEQNSTNLLLWPPICRYKPAITPKWFNSLDTNSKHDLFIYIYLKKIGGASHHIPIRSGGPDEYHEAIVIRSMTDKW